MIVYGVEGAPDMTDVLLWDEIEQEWRIGHSRELAAAGGKSFWCACSVREAQDLIDEDDPVPVFTDVRMWAPLPMPVVGGIA